MRSDGRDGSRGRLRVAVVGAGVSGLVTAHRLLTAAPPRTGPVEVVVVEASDRTGGHIHAADVAGLTVDTGPDSVIDRPPEVGRLYAELGLTDSVRRPAVGGAYLWARDVWPAGPWSRQDGGGGARLRPLPMSRVFGVPDRILPLLRSGVLSPPGAVRAALDLLAPRSTPAGDPSIGQLLRRRLGDEVVDRIVEPLVGGIHAGRVDELSAASAVPDLRGVLTESRSVYLAARRRRTGQRPDGGRPTSPFTSFPGGLTRLVEALAAAGGDAELRLGTRVDALRRSSDLLDVVTATPVPDDGFDAVVLTTPAHATAAILDGTAPSAAQALRGIPYADVATVTLAVPRDAVRRPLDAGGFLVPPVDGRMLLGCSWLTAKWADLANDRVAVFRAMVGRSDDDRWVAMSDDELVRVVHAELDAAVGVSAPPVATHVQRWPQAIPQYSVGHAQRLDAVERALADHPGVYVTGAAYRGSGVAACITQARATADRLLADHAHGDGGRRPAAQLTPAGTGR